MQIETSTKIIVSQNIARRSEMTFGDLAVRTGWNSQLTKDIRATLEAGNVYDMGDNVLIAVKH